MNKKILIAIILGVVCIGLGIVFFFGLSNSKEMIVSGGSSGNENMQGYYSNVNQYVPNPELDYFNVTLDNGLKISYRNYTVTYQPLFVMENGNTYTWSQIPITINKDLWKIKVSPSKYKYGVDFSNVPDNIRSNLKYVVLHRTNATKNGAPMTLQDIQGKIKIQRSSIIINDEITISHADVLNTYSIPLINRSDIVIGNLNNSWNVCDNNNCSVNHTEYNWIDNGDGTWNITFDPTITLDSGDVVGLSILTNVTAETGVANFTHLNISTTAPYDELLGYWNFDGDKENTKLTTHYDFTKENNDGIGEADALVNSSNCLPNFGNCYQSDGSLDTVFIEPSPVTVSPFTVTLWFRFTGTIGANDYNLFQIQDKDASSDQWRGHIEQASPAGLTLNIRDSGDLQDVTTSNDISANTWHFATYVIESSTNGTVILDADFVNQATLTSDITPINIDSMNIGMEGDASPADSWLGQIDEVMVFNVSLTHQQILDIYNNQSARFLPRGRQDINNQTFMNISSGYDRVRVSTQIQENKDSDINLTVGYYDGSWSATAPQTISSLTNYTFNISTASTNLTLNYTFIAGNSTTNPFYSPIIENDITFETFMSPDTTNPTWSSNQTNNTVVKRSTNFSILWDDNQDLHPKGQYIFSTNNSGGTWTNDSAINFTTTPSPANVAKVLNDTAGISIGYRWYATDNAGNLNDSIIFTLTTTSVPNITVESDDNNHTHLTINNLSLPYTDLYGYWSFDGDNVNTVGARAYDWSSRQLNTTMLFDAVVNSTAGRYGNGLALETEGAAVDLGSSFHVDYLTISAWVNPSVSNFGARSKMISSDIGAGSLVEWQFFGLLGGTSYRFRVDTVGGFTTLDTSSFNTAGTWYHMVATYNGTNMSIYVDGVLNASVGHSNPGVIKTLGYNRSIGAQGGKVRNGTWNGSIDEVMIFNRSLTALEVADIYNNQTDRFFSTGRWDLGNKSISTGNDRLNVTTTISTEFNSQINLTVNYYNGSWQTTAPQVVVSNTNLTFTISNNTNIIVTNYTFIAGNSTANPFYTPIIHGQPNFTAFSSTVTDTSFTVTLPTGTLEAIYNASNSTHKNVQPINQTSSVPFFNITNIGNVNLDFNVSINASLPAGIVLKGDTDNDPTGATPINTSTVPIFTTLTPTTSFSIWYWSDFTNALEQIVVRQLNMTTKQS